MEGPELSDESERSETEGTEEEDDAEDRDEGGSGEEDEVSEGEPLKEEADEEKSTTFDETTVLIKNITTLYSLHKDDWTDIVLQEIDKFVHNPGRVLLVLYYYDNKLQASGNFPKVAINDCMFFLRTCQELITIENFYDVVVFQTCHKDLEETILNVIRHIYGPIFFQNVTWPNSVKNEFCQSLHECLAQLTEISSKICGHSELYGPLEGIDVPVEDANKPEHKELIRRLENVLTHWSRQFRIAVHDVNEKTRALLITPIDEYNFWEYRWENLSLLMVQMDAPEMKHVIDLLSSAQSAYIREFKKLLAETGDGVEEAHSNLSYLQVLFEPSKRLNKAEKPSDIPDLIPRLINLSRAIWLHSLHYNTPERVIPLFKSIYNQIILLCKDFISLDGIFIQGKTRAAISSIEEIINCCTKCRIIYHYIREGHLAEFRDDPWDLDESSLFTHLDTFTNRCRNLIEICHAMIIFGRIDETTMVKKPLFGGTKGPELSAIVVEVEKRFGAALNKIIKKRDAILDVLCPNWHEEMVQFRAEKQHLELLLENLLESAMMQVNTIDEGLYVLQGFYYYSRHPTLFPMYEKKTVELWKRLLGIIQKLRHSLSEGTLKKQVQAPIYGGAALLVHLKTQHLLRNKRLLESAEWLPPVALATEAKSQLESILQRSQTAIRNLFFKWNESLEEETLKLLDRSLLVRSTFMAGLMEANLDPMVLHITNECRYWREMNYVLPHPAEQLFKVWPKVKITYEGILTVVNAYNKIVSELSEQERLLFKEHLKKVDQKLSPGMYKHKWDSDTDDYISVCIAEIAELQEFVNVYKASLLKITILCEKMCDAKLLYIPQGEVFNLDDFEKHIDEQVTLGLVRIVNLYRRLVEHIAVIYEGFEEFIESCGEYWHVFILKMDKLMEESILLCVQSALKTLLKALGGDEERLFEASPFIHIYIHLEASDCEYDTKQVELIPSIEYVSEMADGFLNVIVSAFDVVPRIYQKLNMKGMQPEPFSAVIALNSDCQLLQKAMTRQVAKNVQFIYDYLSKWAPYRYLWETPKPVFLEKYLSKDPSDTDWDTDISNFDHIAKIAMAEKAVTPVHFTRLDAGPLKLGIVKQCFEWKEILCDVLQNKINEAILDIFDYCKKHTERVLQKPKELTDWQKALDTYEEIFSDVEIMEKKFPKINDLFAVLEKQEIDLDPELEENRKMLPGCWEKYLKHLKEAELMLEGTKDNFKCHILDETDSYLKEISELVEEFKLNGPFSSASKAKDAVEYLSDVKNNIDRLKKLETRIQSDLALFEIFQVNNPELIALESEVNYLASVWDVVYNWENFWDSLKDQYFFKLNVDHMEENVMLLLKQLIRLSADLKEKDWDIVDKPRDHADAVRRCLPLFVDLKNSCLRQRHWDAIRNLVLSDFDQNSINFTTGAVLEIKLQDFAQEINELSRAATMELNIENGLKTIRDTWATINLSLEPYKDMRNLYRIKAVDDIIQTLEENQTTLAGMKGTKYVEPFLEEVDYWERSLSAIDEVLELLLNVQRHWLYLENIFGGEDIKKQLPEETKVFFKLTATWQDITSKMYAHKNALEISKIPQLFLTLNIMTEELEDIQRALEVYLETKRYTFPRFYFISNDDLLEILGNSKKPELIQPHLKKLFDNIVKLKMIKNGLHIEAVQMFSADGEFIDFSRPVICEGPVERWLGDLLAVMRTSLKYELKTTKNALKKTLNKRTKWLKDQPGQMCITSSQIQWTTDCTKALMSCKVLDAKLPLKRLRSKMKRVLESYSELLRSNLAKIQRLKVVALVTIEIHARDVVDTLYRAGCMDVSAFQWVAQLRFYWSRMGDNEDCVVKQTNTVFNYGYEYLGNSGRLAITPLTDRCYITLTTALHMYRGGSPKGPAGTGKTETVKDLGKALAYYVIVINCSEGLDYKSMGRMFSGFAQTGAWGCFDEFNRINIEVLSVVAQQIHSILSALSQKLSRFVFEGAEINLVPTCGIFITMNPGYAGRTELPDNLKAMFRPVSMVVPDSALIAEITLFGEGFSDSRVLAKKVVTLFLLCKQQLSKEDHYDFGLRGMVALLRHAGLKRRKFPHLPHEEVALLAIRDMNIAKLTTNDLVLFNGITQDLFPGVNAPAVENSDLFRAVKLEMKRANLHFTPQGLLETMSDPTITQCPVRPNVIVPWMKKVLQLYETKTSRHSVIIVGATCTGKTTTWKLLKAGMSSLQRKGYEHVIEYPLNPKTLSLGELFGEFNLAKGEWLDGVVSSIMRKVCAEETPDEKWILFDGPIDAVWIENMNSAMDDNKILTLINSERISMPEQVSFLFEVEDLQEASPATISRCGMVYTDYADIMWKPYVQSWLNTITSNLLIVTLADLFMRILPRVLLFKKTHCCELIPVHELACVRGLCRLLEIFCTKENGLDEKNHDAFASMVKLWFWFCLIWSVCGTLDEPSRQKMDAYIRELEGVFPARHTVYEYFVDVTHRNLLHWETKLDDHWKYNPNIQFHDILVPTVDTVRYEFLINTLLKSNHFPLIVGPVGTGKTSMIQNVLCGSGSGDAVLLMNLSAQTSVKGLQEVIEGRLEKRTKGVYYPVAGKRLLLFMDDFNMPAKETYGAQPPLELLRHWSEYEFWYDRQKQTRKYIKNMVIIGSMGPPGGGRNPIPNRLVSKFHTVALTFPDNVQVSRIFKLMLQQHMASFRDEVKSLAEGVANMTVSLFSAMIENLLPTPNKSHYLFNLRDISRVFQGLLRSHKDYQNTSHKFLRLWIYEAFRVFYDRLVDEKDHQWFVTKLDEVLGVHFDMTFGALCPDKKCPIFGDFLNPYQIYEDLLDFNALKNFMEQQLHDFNSTPGVIKINLVFFRDAIEHICRIVRVVSRPRGNMLLVGIGGYGKQSLEKLALFICKYRPFEIAVSRNYKLREFREDLKILYKQTGVDNKQIGFMFRDTQIVVEDFLEIINSMLSTGEAPNLFRTDELDEIRNNLTPAAEKQGFVLTLETVLDFLIERARTNLHILLSMTPSDEAFRRRLMKYPGLVSCTTLDWFQSWPEEALLEVAVHKLQCCNFTETIFPVNMGKGEVERYQNMMVHAVSSIFARVHIAVDKASVRMKNEMKRICYITPTSFLRLISSYTTQLYEKRRVMKDQANKLKKGLGRIDEAQDSVVVMTTQLEKASAKVTEIQEQCEKAMEVMVGKRQQADEQAKLVQIKSEKIAEEETECKKLARIAQTDLDEAMPAVEEAMAALDALSKKDISELKSYGKPPPKVMMVMEAVCILKGVTPDWAESKRLLGEQDFLKSLRDYDKDHIPEKVMKKVATYTSNPEFNPEEVEAVSLAAKSLCMWVIAIEAYGKLWRVVGPKKTYLDETLKSLKMKQTEVVKLQEELTALHDIINQLNEEFQAKNNELQNLKSKADLLQLKLNRAAMLVDGLAEEKLRWEATVASCEEQFNNLPGDCLLPAAFLSYIGPFVSEYREMLLGEWGEIIEEYEEVSRSKGLKLLDFIVDPALVNDWNSMGLPCDEFSKQNGILVVTSQMWPLIIDPLSQCNKWIKNLEQSNGLKVVHLEQTDMLQTMESCIVNGLPVLLQNVYEELDPSLASVIRKSLVVQSGQLLMNFNEKYIVYNDKFRLYITTKLANPHYPPEITVKTTLVNFAVKQEGLEAQLLGIVVKRERPELEDLKTKTLQTISVGRKTLLTLEAELLHLLYETKGSLLENDQLFETLQISRVTSRNVKESVQMALITEVEIEEARSEYLPCATRAALLFVVLSDLSQVDPMYQFSLDSYLHLFHTSVEKSTKSVDLKDRITNISDYHTFAVYKNTCRVLFGDHKLLFAFYICVKILQAQGKISTEEYMFLLKGGIVMKREEQKENPAPSWITEAAWDNITELEKVPGLQRVVRSFQESPRDWNAWKTSLMGRFSMRDIFDRYLSTFPEKTHLPVGWESASDFTRLLFLRSLREDRLTIAVSEFVKKKLGRPFVEPPVLDIKGVYEDSSPFVPLIFILSPGVDPTASLLSFASHMGMGKHLLTLSLGQGQAPIAERFIEQGIEEGYWVFLANCHLSLSWMSALDKIVEGFRARTHIHSNFRLWLSSTPHPDFPISILQDGLKMTTEPPHGLKGNLLRLYNSISETTFLKCARREKYQKLLFSLSFFHIVLLERKKFQELGWNVHYSFNDSDFEVSEHILSMYLDEYAETPWDALKYLIAEVSYGGHISDDWDRRLMMTYAQQYFSNDVIDISLYRLSSLPTYYVPRDGPLESYRDYISTLPSVDPPEAFGQHFNADINYSIGKAKILCSTLMSLEQQTSVLVGGAATKEEKVIEVAQEVLNQLPAEIDLEAAKTNMGRQPLDIVFLQEAERYNKLLKVVASSLKEIQLGVSGRTVMTQDSEDTFMCLFSGRIPVIWLKAYSSLKPLGSWTRDLYQRLEYLRHWADTTRPPFLHWIATFTFPTGFLTAVLQTSARANSISIDLLSWEFTIINLDEEKIADAPREGVYVRGLFLEGAGWDRRASCLVEPNPMQLISGMPVIWFKPTDAGKKRTKGIYTCPTYYYPIRAGSFVVAVDLSSGAENSDFWIKRGTALLLTHSN